jgi:hypothetical protein
VGTQCIFPREPSFGCNANLLANKPFWPEECIAKWLATHGCPGHVHCPKSAPASGKSLQNQVSRHGSIFGILARSPALPEACFSPLVPVRKVSTPIREVSIKIENSQFLIFGILARSA